MMAATRCLVIAFTLALAPLGSGLDERSSTSAGDSCVGDRCIADVTALLQYQTQVSSPELVDEKKDLVIKSIGGSQADAEALILEGARSAMGFPASGSGGSKPAGSGGSGSSSLEPASPSNFCNGVLTSMHMRGFASVFGGDRSSRPCIVFLMPSWPLDTPVKFVIGCLAAVALGVLTGALLAMRKLSARTPCSFVCVQLPLYGLTLFLGYIDMLLVMAYNLELILAVVFGLTCGHALFRPSMASDDDCDGATPCCANSSK